MNILIENHVDLGPGTLPWEAAHMLLDSCLSSRYLSSQSRCIKAKVSALSIRAMVAKFPAENVTFIIRKGIVELFKKDESWHSGKKEEYRKKYNYQCMAIL